MNSKTQSLEIPIILYLKTFENITKPFDSLEDLADGIIISNLMSLDENMNINKQEICYEPINLPQKLSNLKILLQKLQLYYSLILKNSLNRQNIDLIEIAKNNNREQILNLFFTFLGAAIQGQNKQFFIQKILTLPQEFQNQFVNIIREILSVSNRESSQNPKIEQSIERRLLHKLDQLENQNDKLQKIILELVEEKQEIKNKIEQMNSLLTHQKQQNQKLYEILRESTLSLTETQKIKQKQKQNLKNTIQVLKKKIIDITKQHQSQKIKIRYQLEAEFNTEIIFQLRNQIQIYKQKYQEFRKKFHQYSAYEDEKKQFIKSNQQKDLLIKKLQEKNQELVEKIFSYEQKQVQLNIDLQKKNSKINELYKQIQIIKNNIEIPSLKLYHTKSLSEVCPQIQQEQCNRLRQKNSVLINDLEKSTNCIKLLEKELEKIRKECQRVKSLEIQNKKLSEILQEYSDSRGQQNQILMGVIYELRIKYREVKEQLNKDKISITRPHNLNRILNKKLIGYQ